MSAWGWPLLLALAILFTTGTLAEAPSEPDRAAFHHLHGFTATGDILGECSVVGFRLDVAAPRSLTFTAANTGLVLYETWRNSTVLHAHVAHETLVTVEQHVRKIPLPPGPLSLDWGPGAHPFLKHNSENPTLTTNLSGSHWIASPSENGLRVGPGYYYETIPSGDLIRLDSTLPGNARWLKADQTAYQVHGDGAFRLDAVAISGQAFQLKMPPYKQFFRSDETPFVSTRIVLHTHAELQVEGLDVTIPDDYGDLACGAMAWTGAGAVTFRASTGTVTHDGVTQEFAGKEFTLNGAFAFHETPSQAEMPWGQQIRMDTQAVGRFASGADYEPLGGMSTSARSRAQGLTVFAMLSALLVVLWKLAPAVTPLFTRIAAANALSHPLRALICEVAYREPGANLADLVREAGVSYSTIRHHAGLLVKLEMIGLVRFGRDVHVLPPRTSRGEARRIVSLRSRDVQYLMTFLGSGERPLREVRAALQADSSHGPSWATRLIAKAERAGLVSRERSEEGWLLCARIP